MLSSALRAVALTVAISSALACQDSAGEDRPPPSTTGTGGGIGGGRNFDGGGASELRISVISPKNMDVIKSGTSAEVRAKVLSVRTGTNDPSGDPVDPGSVQVSLRRQADNNLLVSGPLFGPLANNEFAAPFDLSKAPTGDYQLIVTAKSQSGAMGTVSILVRVDAGPTITISSPRDQGSYKGGLTVEVTIDPGPFGPAMNIAASIATTPLTLTPVPGTPNLYQVAVEFLTFPSPLDGEQILRVSATNALTTKSEASARFTVDNQGPTFSLTEPKEGSVVGGIIRLRAKVADPSGVDGTTLIAAIGNRIDVTYTVELKPEAEAGVFSGLFDTSKLTSCRPAPDPKLCIVFPNVSFRASDLAGNEAVVAYDIGVDNHPPIVDLFPPTTLRIARFDQPTKKLVCSFPFDPLGDYRQLGDMPDDLCAVPQVFDLRARIQDAGNRADGLKHAPISLVDPGSVAVFVMGEANGKPPLVVDLDADGVCDAINPMLVPTTKRVSASNEVLTIRLAPVPFKGGADFTRDESLLFSPGRELYPACSPGTAQLAPPRLCGSEPLSVVIGYPAAIGPHPAIWTLEPITLTEPLCVGSQFDSYANEIPEGWACVAATAADGLGNIAASNPLRVWIQYRGLPNGPTCSAPPPNAGPPPNCTGSFDPRAGAVTAGTCRGRSFPPYEVINQGALPEGPGL